MISSRSDSNVLIATEAQDEALSRLESEESVQLVSDPGALREKLNDPYDVIVVDVAMATAAGADLLRSRGSVVITHEADLVEAVREASTSQPRALPAQLGQEVVRLVAEKALAHGMRPEPSAPADALDDLLTRRRSTAEEALLRRRALQAAFAERRRLLQDGLTTQEVADLLVVSRQTPHDRVKGKAMLAIEDNGQLRFPPWQFDADGPNGIVEGLPDVLRALTVGPLAKARWLQKAHPALEGRTPLEALKNGERERVIAEARGVAATAGGGSG